MTYRILHQDGSVFVTLKHFDTRIDEITSNQTSIRGERVNIIFNALGITAEKFNVQITTPIIEKEEEISPIDSVIISEESFAEQYYRTARELDAINFLIVGQDPYPTGANGVAFCKDNYYSLYVEEPETSRCYSILNLWVLILIKLEQ